MPDLIDLQTFKASSRIDFADDDGLGALLVAAASESILAYLKVNGSSDFYDGATLTAAVPANVQAATAILAGILYENYNDDPNKSFPVNGYLPNQVTALLYQRHDPAIA